MASQASLHFERRTHIDKILLDKFCVKRKTKDGSKTEENQKQELNWDWILN